ncbi:hydroxymethylglutaryl-CoA reductase, degradative [Apilactobacillus xinyiensis]|uniref:hydroxymethylglutaryl-CoA reductase, degradative n=1 Tax=Apilactobacillus xinyiensis TaxID=2841032 RepID=UPI00200D5BB2|nr:hydroxymethylglutaryl-CoA reductase, degradative [Apilactobacillus xinyiensis]MCL0330447.1 hydroxymethylglutaryl-CoA reductase, degradative [Apilactobacillus xinyiensis]
MTEFRHFYTKNYKDRLNIISKFSNIDAQYVNEKTDFNAINDNLIENYVTDYSLPEGVCVNLKVNGKTYVVPMVTEEPSVIAAASNGANLLSSFDGIQADVDKRLLTGQIIIKTNNYNLLYGYVNNHISDIIKIADDAHPSILKYGGGAKKISIRRLDDDYCSIDLSVDVAEAMGANIINTMLEAVAAFLSNRYGDDILMSILSNYATDSLVKVRGTVKYEKLSQSNGLQIAHKIAEASHIAQIDPYRATTHNKGIMNGIDAVVIAMGNDWRSIESAAHAYAANNGNYHGLSTWVVDDDKRELIGEMTLPLPLGYVGGVTNVFPKVKLNQQMAQVNSAKELMKITAGVGLSQNLAALKALVTDGIQKGHMHLQLKSLAMSAGANAGQVKNVVKELRLTKHPSLSDAKLILQKINKGE